MEKYTPLISLTDNPVQDFIIEAIQQRQQKQINVINCFICVFQVLIVIELRIFTEANIDEALKLAKEVKGTFGNKDKIRVTGTGVYRHIQSLNAAFGVGYTYIMIPYIHIYK